MSIGQVCIFHIGKTEHLRHAEATCQSVRKHLPGVPIVMATDKDTPGIQGVDFVFRRPDNVPMERLMLANIADQVRILEVSQKNTLFLDTDVILMDGDIDFAVNDYDAAFTWRDNMGELSKAMPWNYGVIYATPESVPLFRQLHAQCTILGPKHHQWYGNQIALAQVLPCPYSDTEIKWEGHRIRALPCEEWNYTPESVDEAVFHRHVLHFKGPRKDMIPHYLEMALCD